MLQKAAHEALVDLHFPHRQIAQVSERGVAGSKIIERKFNLVLHQHLHTFGGSRQIGEHGILRDLETQPAATDAGCVEHADHLFGKIRMQEFRGAEVDGHPEIIRKQSRLFPHQQICHDLVHHQVPQLVNQPRILGYGDEFSWSNDVVIAPRPADQGLCANRQLVGVHLQLVGNAEFTPAKPFPNSCFQLAEGIDALLHVLLEHPGFVAACRFGFIEGQIGLLHEFFAAAPLGGG